MRFTDLLDLYVLLSALKDAESFDFGYDDKGLYVIIDGNDLHEFFLNGGNEKC